MRREAAILVLVLLPLSSGCAGLFRTGTRNLIYEANLVKDSEIEKHYFAHLADQAWANVQGNCPQQNHSPDYACGFKDGFVDYLYAGGNGEPPALVPKRYLHFREQKARGSQGLLDWYAGFRHGASVAHASGFRKALVIALPPPPMPPPAPPLPGPVLGENMPPVNPSVLPMPRSQPAQDAKPVKPAGKAPPDRGGSTGLAQPDSHGPDIPTQEEEEPKAAPAQEEPTEQEKQP
jgi:hypothetical protein